MKFVSIIMGSKSDYGIMKNCADTLERFGVLHEMIVSSAHRSPERTHNYVKMRRLKGRECLLRRLEWRHIWLV